MQRLTLVVTDEFAERPTYWQEFLAELMDTCDNHFRDGKWYVEAT